MSVPGISVACPQDYPRPEPTPATTPTAYQGDPVQLAHRTSLSLCLLQLQFQTPVKISPETPYRQKVRELEDKDMEITQSRQQKKKKELKKMSIL